VEINRRDLCRWPASVPCCAGGWVPGLNGHFPTIPPGTLAANLIGGYIIGLGNCFLCHIPGGGGPKWRLVDHHGILRWPDDLLNIFRRGSSRLLQQGPARCLLAVRLPPTWSARLP